MSAAIALSLIARTDRLLAIAGSEQEAGNTSIAFKVRALAFAERRPLQVRLFALAGAINAMAIAAKQEATDAGAEAAELAALDEAISAMLDMESALNNAEEAASQALLPL